MRQYIKELEGITYDTKDNEQKKAYLKHYGRIWRQNNKDKVKITFRKYLEKNRERLNECRKMLYANLPEEERKKRREQQRVQANERYATDAEYRERKRKYSLARYYAKKIENNTSHNHCRES